MFEFDRATKVTKVGGDDTVGQYEAEILDGWDIYGAANGGYIGAVMMRAMQLHGGRPDPYTITVHYLMPVPPGRAQIEVETVKRGRLTNSMIAKLTIDDPSGNSDGRIAITAMGAFGNLQSIGREIVKGQPPRIPPYESLETDASGSGPQLMQRLALRLSPEDVGFVLNQPNGQGTMRAWFAFPDDRPMDALSTFIAADATAPAVFNLVGQAGWVPTIELTVHYRQIPTGTRLATSFSSRFVKNGLVEEDGEIWDENGNLIAISRQIAAMPLADY